MVGRRQHARAVNLVCVTSATTVSKVVFPVSSFQGVIGLCWSCDGNIGSTTLMDRECRRMTAEINLVVLAVLVER